MLLGVTCFVAGDHGIELCLLLPTVPTSNLNVAGATAGTTNFTLSITGCTAPIADTPVNTLFIGNNVQPGGILGSSGSATNVGLQLLNGTQSIDLTAPSLQSGLVIGAAATSASHDFSVRYYATGAATAGTVVGSVQYEVAYD